jgi:hypothetical protein
MLIKMSVIKTVLLINWAVLNCSCDKVWRRFFDQKTGIVDKLFVKLKGSKLKKSGF